MKVIPTTIPEVMVVEPQVFEDQRGWFMETYSRFKLAEFGIDVEFVQDNHSLSIPRGTLRGLHFQNKPKAQTKLVRCTRGAILDVAVDIRRGSPTYCRWIMVELSADNKKQLLIPKGFAHGFITITDNSEVQYKVDQYYAPEFDRGIRFNDSEIGVDWGVKQPLLSEKDFRAPLLKDSDCNFVWEPAISD